MDTDILGQLLWIKWLLVAIAVAFVSVAVAMVWAGVLASRAFNTSKAEQPFSEKAKDLLEKGLYAEARALSEERMRTHPGDAYAFWYHAVACYRLGETLTAIRSLRTVIQLQPDWADTHVLPLIVAFESQSNASPRAELRVITPND